MASSPYNHRQREPYGAKPGESEPSFVLVHIVAVAAIVVSVIFVCWWTFS